MNMEKSHNTIKILHYVWVINCEWHVVYLVKVQEAVQKVVFGGLQYQGNGPAFSPESEGHEKCLRKLV